MRVSEVQEIENYITLNATIRDLLKEFKCKIDSDALEYLVGEWNKRYGLEEMDKLREYMEILADYDYGDTESGCLDQKTVEIFIEDEL